MKLKSAVCVCTAQFIYQPRGVYPSRYKNYIQGMETGMQCRNLCTGV